MDYYYDLIEELPSGTITTAVGTASGTGTVTGVGAALDASTGTTSGSGTASGVGASAATSVGTTSGVGTATGVSQGGNSGVGTASGQGTATAVGASIATSVGTSLGHGFANGFSPSVAGSGSGSYLQYERLVNEQRKTHGPYKPVQGKNILERIAESAQILSSAGGHARAQSLTSSQRSSIAKNAAQTRWGK